MIGKSSLVSPQFVFLKASIGIGFGKARIQTDCFIMIGKSSLVSPQFVLRDAPIGIG